MCNTAVTFGGGIMMTYGTGPAPASGVNSPRSCHQA